MKQSVLPSQPPELATEVLQGPPQHAGTPSAIPKCLPNRYFPMFYILGSGDISGLLDQIRNWGPWWKLGTLASRYNSFEREQS